MNLDIQRSLHDENRNFNDISADEYLRSTGSTTQSLINLKSNIKLHDFSVQLSTFRRALHYLDPHENDNASRAVFDMDLSPLIADDSLDLKEYALAYVARLDQSIADQIDDFL